MKIGIDARLLHETGVGRYIRNLLSNLAQIDTENEYVIFLRKKDFATFDLPNERWNKKIAEVPWHSAAEQFVMPFLCYTSGLDMLHVPYFNVPVLYVKKYVVTIHDLTIMDIRTGKASTLPGWMHLIKRIGYRIVLWVSLRTSARIITVSESVKKEIIRRFGVSPSKIAVTYEGIDDRITFPKQVKPRFSGLPGKYFLYVGNVYPHKNIDVLLDAFRRLLKQKGSDVQLVFVGPDDYFYSKLEAVVRSLEMEHAVKIFHGIDDDELAWLYAHAVSLVFPSRMEGFGLPALEALASGCRVIVSDIPVFHEIVRQHARYADTSSAESLSRVMNEVLHAPFDRVAFKKSLVSFLSGFSWRHMAQETLRAYTAFHP